MSSPAVLFYTSDFLTGVLDLTMEERGQYITLLCVQHQKGHLKEETIRLLVGSVSVNVLNKFVKDEKGYYYNPRMELEKEKRDKYSNSRKENGKLGGRPKKAYGNPYDKSKNNHMKNHMDNHMDNDNENDNDNDNRNDNENNLEKIGYGEEKPLNADDVGSLTETFKGIIGYLNLKTGSNYRHNTSSTTSKIKARLNEGYTLDDFKNVIDKKCDEWLNTEMEKYLRPETLFGNKFESYLNQPIRPKKLKDISFKELEEMSEWEKQNF